MQLSTVMNRLSRNDSRIISRDSFLIAMTLYIFVFAVIGRYAFPWFNDLVADIDALTFVLSDYYPLLMGYTLYVGALLAGMIIGFIVLDERDDDTLTALMVTPVTLRQYMIYRVVVPAVIGFGFTLVMFLIINIALPTLWQMILLAAVNSLTGSWVMLVFANFAQNKVQGFVVQKVLGTVGLVLFLAWFIAPPLEYLVGIFPAYWFLKSYWLMLESDPGWITFMLIGLVYNAGVIWYLVKRFEKVVYS